MNDSTALTIEGFVKILDAAGIDAAARKRLHAAYERLDPQGHAAFLAALNAPAAEIERIRAWSRA